MIATIVTLAQSASGASDGMLITGGAIVAIGTATAAVVAAFKKGQASRVSVDPQPLSVALTQTLATKGELAELEARIVAELKKFETALTTERSVARTANGNLHARIDKTVESLMEMKGELHQINANLNRLVDLAMKPAGRKLP